MKLRKQKKDQILREKRSKALDADNSVSALEDEKIDQALKEFYPSLLSAETTDVPPNSSSQKQEEKIRKVSEALTQLMTNLNLINSLVLVARKIPSREKPANISLMLKLGFINKYDQLLAFEPLRRSVVWNLINLSADSTANVDAMLSLGIHRKALAMIDSADEELKEDVQPFRDIVQCVWLLNNMCSDSVKARDQVMEAGFAEKMHDIVKARVMKLYMAKLVSWAISNFFKGKPAAPLKSVLRQLAMSQTSVFLPYFHGLLTVENEDVVKDSLWALVSFTDDSDERLGLFLKSVSLRTILSLMTHKALAVRFPALKIIGNVCLGTNDQVSDVIDSDGLSALKDALNLPGNDIDMTRELCWVVSNIVVGPRDHIQGVIDCGLIADFCSLINTNTDYFVTRETAWAIGNACTVGTPYQVWRMVESGALLAMCKMLDVADPELKLVLLRSIKKVIRCGDSETDENLLAAQFETLDGIRKLEALQHDDNILIYEAAVDIMKTYYNVEETVVSEKARGDGPVTDENSDKNIVKC